MMSVSNHTDIFASQISTALCVCLVVEHSMNHRVAVKPQPSGVFNSLKQTWCPTDRLQLNVHLVANFCSAKMLISACFLLSLLC